MMTKGMFTSDRDDWSTPQEFFDRLNERYCFNLDPCANDQNHKCEKYYTKEIDGLKQNWGGQRVFCNPPYGRELPKWVKKCYEESQKPDTLCVMLIPARTDTRWFHEYIYHKAEIEFIKGRLKFGEGKNSAPFPSMLVTWRAKSE